MEQGIAGAAGRARLQALSVRNNLIREESTGESRCN
jgi:hypothetical protein